MKKIKYITLLIFCFAFTNAQTVKLKQLEKSSGSGSLIVTDATGTAGYTSSIALPLWSTSGNALSTNTNFIGTTNNNALTFKTNNLRRAEITSDGNLYSLGKLSIGTSAFAPSGNIVFSLPADGNSNFSSVYAESTVMPSVSGAFNMFQSAIITNSNTNAIRLVDFDANRTGSSGTIGSNIGFRANANLAYGSNVFGFQGAIPSGSGFYNLYMNGTARNYLAGAVGIGTTTSTYSLDVVGNARITSLDVVGNITGRLLKLAAGTTAAGTAPIKLTSGPLNTTAEAGAIEFLTDNLYYTITTGAARKQIGINDIPLTSGRVQFSTTNGRTTDLAAFTYATNRLSPTYITLAAGTAAAGTGQLIFTNGTALTTTVAGQMGYEANTLNFTNSVGRYEVGLYLKGSATLDFPSTPAGMSSTLTIAVTGAALGDPVILGKPVASLPPITQTGSFDAYVSAAGVVTVVFMNTNTSAAFDPPSGTFKVAVNKN